MADQILNQSATLPLTHPEVGYPLRCSQAMARGSLSFAELSVVNRATRTSSGRFLSAC